MKIEFDAQKSLKNQHERGLPFTLVEKFDFDTAHVTEDKRKDYPERRFVAAGYIGNRLHILCFSPLEDGIRVISLRKANERETKTYHEEKASD